MTATFWVKTAMAESLVSIGDSAIFVIHINNSGIIKIASDNSVISDPDETSTERGTIAHEVGHALGLSHRILNKDSVLVQVAYDRETQYPSTIDFDGITHLKNAIGE